MQILHLPLHRSHLYPAHLLSPPTRALRRMHLSTSRECQPSLQRPQRAFAQHHGQLRARDSALGAPVYPVFQCIGSRRIDTRAHSSASGRGPPYHTISSRDTRQTTPSGADAGRGLRHESPDCATRGHARHPTTLRARTTGRRFSDRPGIQPGNHSRLPSPTFYAPIWRELPLRRIK